MMKKIAEVAAKVLEYIVGVLLLVIFATALSEVFARYVLGSSILWAIEFNILLMIWAVWLSAAIGVHRKAHMRVTLISERLPVKAQRVLTIFIDLCTLFLFLILGIKGVEVVQSLEGMDLITMPIPRGIVFAAAPVGAALMILILIPILIEDLKVLFLHAKERGIK